jgi:hypothetical protein
MDLERQHDDVFAMIAASDSQKLGGIREALSIVDPGHGIGRCEVRRSAFTLGSLIGFVLEFDVASPTEKYEHDVQSQRRRRKTDVGPEYLALQADLMKKGATVPD